MNKSIDNVPKTFSKQENEVEEFEVLFPRSPTKTVRQTFFEGKRIYEITFSNIDTTLNTTMSFIVYVDASNGNVLLSSRTE